MNGVTNFVSNRYKIAGMEFMGVDTLPACKPFDRNFNLPLSFPNLFPINENEIPFVPVVSGLVNEIWAKEIFGERPLPCVYIVDPVFLSSVGREI